MATDDTGKSGPQTGATKPGDEPDTDHREHEDRRPRSGGDDASNDRTEGPR